MCCTSVFYSAYINCKWGLTFVLYVDYHIYKHINIVTFNAYKPQSYPFFCLDISCALYIIIILKKVNWSTLPNESLNTIHPTSCFDQFPFENALSCTVYKLFILYNYSIIFTVKLTWSDLCIQQLSSCSMNQSNE